MIVYQPRQLALPDGSPSGRWHVVGESDEGGIAFAACSCADAHESPEAARACPEASARLAREGLGLPPRSSLGDLAALAFEAYGASTGGKTWDGKDIPPFAVVRERTPHVARAWEAAVDAVLKAVQR